MPTLVVFPAGMVSVLFALRATASAGDADTVTIVSTVDGLCSVAVTGSAFPALLQPILRQRETHSRRERGRAPTKIRSKCPSVVEVPHGVCRSVCTSGRVVRRNAHWITVVGLVRI